MFEAATRKKIRFSTTRGLLTAEDLWDLPLTSGTKVDLDKIAIALSKELKDTTEESFVKVATKSSVALQLKFDIVKHIIETKMAEAKAKVDKAEIADRKALLVGALATKQAEELAGKSSEEILEAIAKLEAK